MDGIQSANCFTHNVLSVNQAAAVIVRRRFPPLKVWLVERSEKREPVLLLQH